MARLVFAQQPQHPIGADRRTIKSTPGRGGPVRVAAPSKTIQVSQHHLDLDTVAKKDPKSDLLRVGQLPRPQTLFQGPLCSVRPRALADSQPARRGGAELSRSAVQDLPLQHHPTSGLRTETGWVQSTTPPSSWYNSPDVWEYQKQAIFGRQWTVSRLLCARLLCSAVRQSFPLTELWCSSLGTATR